ncbi:Uncharacterised protein [Vibrio cholerae]|nr:Uncharacterised protein [Vibrio cholerae]
MVEHIHTRLTCLRQHFVKEKNVFSILRSSQEALLNLETLL